MLILHLECWEFLECNSTQGGDRITGGSRGHGGQLRIAGRQKVTSFGQSLLVMGLDRECNPHLTKNRRWVFLEKMSGTHLTVGE